MDDVGVSVADESDDVGVLAIEGVLDSGVPGGSEAEGTEASGSSSSIISSGGCLFLI